MITRQEIITSLHEPDKFILAIVQVENGFARAPRYVRGALDDREPLFEQTAIQFTSIACWSGRRPQHDQAL